MIGLGLAPTMQRATGAPTISTDALAVRSRAEIAAFAAWCTATGAQGFVGEIGWRNDDNDAAWNALAAAWFVEANATNLPALAWGPAEQFPSYNVSPYWPASYQLPLSRVNDNAGPLEYHYSRSTALWRGVSVLSGTDGAPYSGEATSTFSNLAPGTYGTAYTYESAASFAFLKSRGVRTVMICFRWERLQPTLGSAFNATELTRLTTCVDAAIAAGLQVILQPFNKGYYYKDVAGTGTRFSIGSATVTQAHFTDLWTRMCTAFAAKAGVVGFGLMNEPQIIPASWQTYSQAAVDAIRTALATQWCIVPCSPQYSAYGFRMLHPTAWITDALSKTAYEVHHYWDSDRSGAYAATYATELASAVAGLNVNDTFTRANNAELSAGVANSGQPWSSFQMGIISNTAYVSAGAGQYGEGYVDGRWFNGTWSVTLPAIQAVPSNGEAFLTFRVNQPNTFKLHFGWSYGGWILRRESGGNTTLGTAASPALTAGQVLSVVANGSSIACKVNGATVISVTETNGLYNTICGIDAFDVAALRFDALSFVPSYT